MEEASLAVVLYWMTLVDAQYDSAAVDVWSQGVDGGIHGANTRAHRGQTAKR